MTYYQYIITGIILIILINFIINMFFFKNIKRYRLSEGLKKTLPLVSVLIPARNEESNIKKIISSILKQDYENLEILVLDDNSSDSTAAIVKNMENKDSRIRLIKGKKLEDNWLGKSWACHQLALNAKGEYFIFTDADTLHFPDTVTKALAALTNNNLDGLSVYPRQIMVSFIERMVIPFMGLGLFTMIPLGLVKSTRFRFFSTGIGQFFMFRKDVYFKFGGHESVRAEVLEDVCLSKKIKAAGFRYMVFDGSSNIFCRMYKNRKETITGFSKVIFAAYDYNILTMSLAIILFSMIFLVPFLLLPVAIIFKWSGTLLILNIIQIFSVFMIKIVMCLRLKERFMDIFLTPVSLFYIISIAINSYISFKFKKGVCWKGRTYDVNTPEEIYLIDETGDV